MAISQFIPSRLNVLRSEEAPGLCMVIMRRDESICFQGCILVAPILGSITIMNHTLRGPISTSYNIQFTDLLDENVTIPYYPLFSPSSDGLLKLEPNRWPTEYELNARSNIKVTKDEKRIAIELLNQLMDTDDILLIILLREMAWCGIDGIERVAPSLYKNLFTGQVGQEGSADAEDLLRLNLFRPIFESTPGLFVLSYPETWTGAINQFVSEAVQLASRSIPAVSITYGQKNVGKSTFSRMLINALLNVFPKVAYVESDVGQSEFTPAGLVSLTICESPLFGPSFTHLSQPYRSYFIGDTKPRDDPDYYLTCLNELVNVYRHEIAMDQIRYVDEDTKSQNIVPLIFNTHGWTKGLGHDIILGIIKFLKPTHIFQFQSPTNSYRNCPTIPTTSDVQHKDHLPKHVIIDIPDSVSSPTRLSPHTRRTLNFLSYFYSSNLLELNSPWWDYNNPLVYRVPWCLNWKKGLSKGVILINSDVSLSHLLYALNGSVVGLIGDAVVDEETAVDACDEDRYNDEKIDVTKPVNAFPPLYYRSPPHPLPHPSNYTCHGLAIIRSISPSTNTLHILTPVPYATLRKVTAIMKGSLELPVWAMLDHSSKSSTHLCGVPWERVPYLSLDPTGGVGHSSTSVRKNLMRRGQQKQQGSKSDGT